MRTSFNRSVTTLAGAAVATTAIVGTALATAGGASAQNQVSTAGTLEYKPIQEPFTTPVGACDPEGNTLEMTNCFLKKVVSTDKKINALQKERFSEAGSDQQRRAYLKNDAQWLKKRAAEAREVRQGGSIDSIRSAQKMLQLSKKRLNKLQH
ncbi:lysozyme inhibitor LprI family protein [Kineosporia rhizophila]|uniref:lysozyme inhibitor LprI family protein n=1 Tax=Kineosporia TaxID=49184 RepID=UPI001E50C2AB|nr:MULTISPECIES: lysozyme inhibitor LprI family protein [Kineosporia]MCE0538032.1 lysozyme inhibitor LprI family protein [Kineosporia rhizophila]GLY17079.1 hypothetical protein Kisp01_40940 [Kineosporia sp. NBRC 101677]